MKKIGIVQPGRLGDIIICLPIAKYYYDKGYEVYWPIFNTLIHNFTKTILYVKFIPVSNNVYTCVNEANNILQQIQDIQIFDIAATFPGSVSTHEYVSEGDGFGSETFDMFKYRKCNVPFEYKWCLEYNRDYNEESLVYNTEVGSSKSYIVTGLNHSKGYANVKVETNKPIITINEKYCIFSWLPTLSNANTLVLVDSSMANFVEQMNLNNKKILITKPNEPRPFFKNNWIIK